MKRFTAALLLLVSTCALGADRPHDGFYLRAQGEPAPWIKSQDGQKLFLGAKQTLKIQRSDLSSVNNANTRFNLSVAVPNDGSIWPPTYILIVADTAYRQVTSFVSRDRTSSSYFCFEVSEEKNAKQVSEYMKTPLLCRRRPRHKLRVSFTPTEQKFSVGDEVTATLRIANVGTNSVSFRRDVRNRAARDNEYAFSARHRGKQVEDIGTSLRFRGFSSVFSVRRVLKPGEVFEDEISLSKWFSFDKAGTYEVHGSYYLAFYDSDALSSRVIWKDHVSADFTVRIRGIDEASNKPDAGDGE